MSKVIDEPNFRNKNRVFDDRFHAGEILSQKLKQYANRGDTYILAIPAGGIQVAVVVANISAGSDQVPLPRRNEP